MNNHVAKFTFLVVMVGAVLFSRFAYPAAAPANSARTAAAAHNNAQSAEVPLFVFPSMVITEQNVPTPPSTSAAVVASAASLAMDLQNGTVLYAANADKRWPTASIAKLMSATIVQDKIDPATKITITEGMFAADLAESTLAVGDTYAASDLTRLMLLPSSNVAAEALATFYGRTAFVAEMNARAAAWGMGDTHFDDPSGISAADQSTANDLAKLAGKINADYPQVFQVARTPQVSVTEQNSGRKTVIKSINNFAGDADFVGGKTGYTTEAGGNLLSVFRYAGRTVLVVVLGSANRFGDTRTLYAQAKTNIK